MNQTNFMDLCCASDIFSTETRGGCALHTMFLSTSNFFLGTPLILLYVTIPQFKYMEIANLGFYIDKYKIVPEYILLEDCSQMTKYCVTLRYMRPSRNLEGNFPVPAQISASFRFNMASAAKRSRTASLSGERLLGLLEQGDDGNDGMSSEEESDLDHQLENSSDESR